MTKINDDLRYRVGIDVGLKSIGFCAVEVDDKDQPLRLLNSMVFIHDAGVDPNENKAAKSRKLTAGVARRTQRRTAQNRRRLAELDRVLSEELHWPLPNLEDFEDPYEPWHTRAELVDHYIEDESERLEALSIAVRHMARHRGWRNPYIKVDSLLTPVEPSEFLRGLNERVGEALGREFPEETTPGQLISEYMSDPKYRESNGIRGDDGILQGKLHQYDNTAEIRKICEIQRLDHDVFKLLVRKVFFAKSPRGSAAGLVGHDQLPGQGKFIRAEKAHPDFQLFRIVSVLTNLRVREAGAERCLTPEELSGLTDFLLDAGLKQQVTWADLADNLGIERADLRGTARPSVDGEPALRFPPTDVTTEMIMASKVKWLKEWWKSADSERRGFMVDALSNSGGSTGDDDIDDEVAELLEAATEDEQAELEKIQLPQGRAAYSLDSLRKLTERMLAEGADLHTARKQLFNVDDDWRPEPEPIEAPVGNPAVDRVLKQVARWLNMATDRWGEPVVINIEHTRDGLGSEKVARELLRESQRRQDLNQKNMDEMIQQLGISGKARRSALVKHQAIQRQNSMCLYCGTAIGFETAEMDHIVPRASSGSSNERSNLAAVCRTCNHQKGAVPFAVWATSGQAHAGVSLEGAIERVRAWERDPAMSPKQYAHFRKEVISRLKSRKPDEEFDGRSMESVAWMAIELRTRIDGFYRKLKAESVPSIGIYRGQLTAEARKASGFENRVNLIGGKGKTRFDRRHHAMDALVIALMNQSVSQTLALRVNMRESQRITGQEETWKNFYGKPGQASERFEQWREGMLRAVELFNIELAKNAIPFHENVRLRVGSSKVHDDTVRKFIHAKLGEALSVAMIDRAETPALWTALTRLPDFDPKEGLPEDQSREIYIHGRKITADEELNFFNSPSACLKVRGGYVEIGSSIHHARVYRIDGKKTTYAMVRVFATDLVKMTHEDVFTTPLKASTISMRTAEPKIRKALADGTATQIGWLVEGDELQIETDKYTSGSVGNVLAQYPQLISWRVAGFYGVTQLRLRPYMLAAEGIPSDASDSLRKVVEGKGWLPAINTLLSSGDVWVVRRNSLGEVRFSTKDSLPVTHLLR
ncbi:MULTISPECIES: type II CRISPR RNA-guided endonuclease Cas9 [Actinomyces]|uniref:type II CRISPR RNA-guided endonuclease Cas9 n=1 Tax=Actinomyces TaxID=1654 RepID=UPI00093141E2|nr:MULTISPECIES: type II CRISPR RNA-guided endonuclease Cas9 [Actinomyces]